MEEDVKAIVELHPQAGAEHNRPCLFFLLS